MNLPSRIIVDFLEAQAVGVAGTSLFENKMPTIKTLYSAVYDSGGGGIVPNSDTNESNPTIQVLCVGSPGSDGYTDALNKAIEIQDLIVNDFDYVSDSDITYLAATQRSGILSLGNDGLNRPMLSQNFELRRSETK